MNAKELKEVIKRHFYHKIPLLILGHPGIGKSQITRETAEELHVEFKDLRLSLLDPTDLRGFPYIDKEKNITRWAIPEFLPNQDNGGILMLDEINLAPPAVQNAAYQLILDRQLGEYTLPPSWMIVAAGNLSLKEGYISQIRSALISRFSVVELNTPSAMEWINEYAIPRKIDPRIIAYLYARPNAIYVESDNKNQNFPNPRNWEKLSILIKDIPSYDPVFEHLATGRLGSSFGIEFMTFCNCDIDWKIWLDESAKPTLPHEIDKKCFLISILGASPDKASGLSRLIVALQKNGDMELATLGFNILQSLLPMEKIMELKYWPAMRNTFGKIIIF
ncbi:MAG: MoxR family ATPase [candidate division WOR-3 bacterium]